jgi:hypothetical protein
MTLHVVYSHQCPSCEAYYIPHDDVPCPRCGELEEERFDYIPQAVESMQYNQRAYGSFTPPAWWIGSLGDHILSLLFGLFDAYDGTGGEKGFADFVIGELGQTSWGDQEYLRDHVRDIALRIHAHMNREEPSCSA